MQMTPTIKIMFIIILLLILILLNYVTQKQDIQLMVYKQNPTTEQMSNDSNTINANIVDTIPSRQNLSNGTMTMMNPIDNELALLQYDYNKMYNVLENPARRVPSYELPPLHLKKLIDYPTRGYPDNFTQYGILKRVSHKHHSPTGEHEHDHAHEEQGNNFIIRLLGRQEYPGSNKYEYYTMINNGFDQIKIPIYNRRNELYDGDEIYIKELNSKYIVSLYRYDQPKYYPDLIY
jgi:hypothetical protein